MATSKSRSSDVSVLPDGLRQFVRNKMLELAGVAVLVIVAALAVALATWSIHDPSFNHATGRSPDNLLGYPGAAISDLLMQLFGIASVALILPVAIWGAKLISHRPILHLARRLVAWLAGGLLAAGCIATVPVTATWPLPTGLGGVLGDYVLAPVATLLSIVVDETATRVISFPPTAPWQGRSCSMPPPHPRGNRHSRPPVRRGGR